MQRAMVPGAGELSTGTSNRTGLPLVRLLCGARTRERGHRVRAVGGNWEADRIFAFTVSPSPHVWGVSDLYLYCIVVLLHWPAHTLHLALVAEKLAPKIIITASGE